MWVAAALFAASVTTAAAQQPQAKPAQPQQPQGKPAVLQPPQAQPAQPQQPQAKPAQPGAKVAQPATNPAQQATVKKGPYGWLDLPAEGSVVSKKTAVSGWALSDQGKVSKIEILLDGKPAKIKLNRFKTPGICAKYPGRTDCMSSGFKGDLDLSQVKPGPHTLAARFTDKTGAAELGKKNITVN
jgi:hypothetical protein